MFGGYIDTNAICGGRHEATLEGYSEEIKSKEIVSFSYTGSYESFSATKEDDGVRIGCSGGGRYNRRDGSLYGINYIGKDLSIFDKLQEVIDKNNETKGNGHTTHVDGLPSGLGDILNITYASDEKIYKYSNQCPTVRPDTRNAFYEIFHDYVVKDGYDFNTAGSNVKLFDDATKEFLQGTWKGKHFGDEIEVTVTGDRLTIKVDGNVTDDNVEYIIFQGNVRINKLKEGIDEPSSYNDYEEFNGLSTFSKRNYFTLCAYFMKESYSTCDLHNFDKPKEE